LFEHGFSENQRPLFGGMLLEKLDFVVITGFRRLWQSRRQPWLDPSPPRETVGDGKVPVVTLSAPVRLSR
jgi:hypothetical protein